MRPSFELLIKYAALVCAVFNLFPSLASGDSGLILEYGQSRRVWSVLYEVQTARGDLQKINRILNENFGEFQTTFSRFGGDFDLFRPGGVYLNKVRFSITAEAAALGLVQNPVLPELLAAAIGVGLARASFEGSFSPEKSWTYEWALLYGYGVERRLSAVSTDLIDKIPFQKDDVWLAGLDLKTERIWKRARDSIGARALWRGTHYKGLKGQTSVSLDRRLRSDTQHWELRGDYAKSWWGLHGIAGSHPLPVELLPRVWDRVANTAPWRELGAMTGFGGHLDWQAGVSSRFRMIGGFYAGYVGGELQLHAGERTVFRVASYKIENSSAYRTLGQRVYALLTYLAF